MEVTTIRLPSYLEDKLEEVAAQRGITKSQLTREIMVAWFKERKYLTMDSEAYRDWRDILYSAEFMGAFREALDSRREVTHQMLRAIFKESFTQTMPLITGAQREIVLDLFHSPEYRDAIRGMVREILLSEEHKQFQVQAIAEILSSEQFVTMLSRVAERVEGRRTVRISPGSELTPGDPG
jgi:hypothetical protein